MHHFARVVGDVLRQARTQHGLTLRQAAQRSDGRFKPSVIGGYERGERSISLSRFCQLAQFYGIPPDRLLAQVMERLDPAARRKTILDLGLLQRMDEEPGRAVSNFISRVKRERGDPTEDVITLRAGDLEAVALTSGIDVERLMAALRPVVRGDGL